MISWRKLTVKEVWMLLRFYSLSCSMKLTSVGIGEVMIHNNRFKKHICAMAWLGVHFPIITNKQSKTDPADRVRTITRESLGLPFQR